MKLTYYIYFVDCNNPDCKAFEAYLSWSELDENTCPLCNSTDCTVELKQQESQEFPDEEE